MSMLALGCCHNASKEAQPMKLQEKVSWLMGTVQRTLFPHLAACLAAPLTAQEKRLVTILALVHIEHYIPKSAARQWLGRPLKAREAIARAFVATAVVGYPHTRACGTRCVPPRPCGPSAAVPPGVPCLLQRRAHAPLRSVPEAVWRRSCMMPWSKSI